VADLVKALVALEGRPWGSGKPLTQNRLARMLKPLAIAPDMTGPENARQRGLWQFEEAFSRYLPPEGGRTSVQNAANTGNGSGLSNRRIQELATWCSDRAYWHYSPNALAAGALEVELRAILRKEVSFERVELEFERVMKEVRGAR
jgi:hypothetical protein